MLRRHKKVLRILFAVGSLIHVLLTEPSGNIDKSECESEEHDPEDEAGFHTSVCIFFYSKIIFNCFVAILDNQATIHHSFGKKKGG